MTDAVRFLLNGAARAVDGLPPTTTVLDYLRTRERLCGTKEGCAEGDCGACTVVVATPDDRGEMRYEAVNSCIRLLPTLDGKHLITVEGLEGDDGALHPVQRAMVDAHASQCGFCTPGFVMSLFALWQAKRSPTRAEVVEALAGNLCRCTGYRPILAAAQRLAEENREENPDENPEEIAEQIAGLRRLTPLCYRHDGRELLIPRTLEELTDIVRRHPAAHLLAGGTDFGLWVTKQHRDFDRIVWVAEVTELRALRTTDAYVEIGAAVTWTQALPVLARHWPSLGELIRRFASPPIRNSATIGGNIANASPIGDGPPPLIALGATLVLLGPDGEREIALEDFFLDYRKTDLRAGEIVARVRVPLPAAGQEFAVYKLSKRLDQDISALCAAFAVRLESGVVAEARLAFGGMAATPRRAHLAEAALAGRPWTAASIERAMAALERDFAPIDDMRASAAYRMLAARNLLRRFQLETAGTPARIAPVRIAYG